MVGHRELFEAPDRRGDEHERVAEQATSCHHLYSTGEQVVRAALASGDEKGAGSIKVIPGPSFFESGLNGDKAKPGSRPGGLASDASRGPSHSCRRNATRSSFSCCVSFISRIRLKNSTVSSSVSSRPSWK